MTRFVTTCTGTAFKPVYVENLYKGIARNFSGEWDFTVVVSPPTQVSWSGNDSFKARFIPSLVNDSASWWDKLNYFRTDIWPKGETVFALDLDTVIIGPLDKLAERKGFNMIGWEKPYWYPVNSSVMTFPAGEYSYLYDNFLYGRKSLYPKGDQEWTHKELLRNGVEPSLIRSDEVASFKRDKWHNGPSDASQATRGASIVAFHGKPRPHELDKDSWGYKAWSGQEL